MGVGGQCHAPVAFTPGNDPLPIVQAGMTRYPLYRSPGGPQGRSGFDPRTVQPVGSRYTDYATRPTIGV